MSICPGQNPNSQILNSQVADELLTIRGIRASFVAGQNEYGKTVVSARSLGDVNVQVDGKIRRRRGISILRERRWRCLRKRSSSASAKR